MVRKAFSVVSCVPFYTQSHMVSGLHAPTYTRVHVHMYILHRQTGMHTSGVLCPRLVTPGSIHPLNEGGVVCISKSLQNS